MSESKGPISSTDRRRHKQHGHGVKSPEGKGKGEGHPLANLFNDRRHHNGHGDSALQHYQSHASKG